MNQQPALAEQRHSFRCACVLEASVPRTGSRVFEPVLLVKVVNISTCGLGLHCSEKLDEDSVITIKLYSRGRISLPPRQARIVHATEQQNGTYLMGAALVEALNDDEIQFLLK